MSEAHRDSDSDFAVVECCGLPFRRPTVQTAVAASPAGVLLRDLQARR